MNRLRRLPADVLPPFSSSTGRQALSARSRRAQGGGLWRGARCRADAAYVLGALVKLGLHAASSTLTRPRCFYAFQRYWIEELCNRPSTRTTSTFSPGLPPRLQHHSSTSKSGARLDDKHLEACGPPAWSPPSSPTRPSALSPSASTLHPLIPRPGRVVESFLAQRPFGPSRASLPPWISSSWLRYSHPLHYAREVRTIVVAWADGRIRAPSGPVDTILARYVRALRGHWLVARHFHSVLRPVGTGLRLHPLPSHRARPGRGARDRLPRSVHLDHVDVVPPRPTDGATSSPPSSGRG